MVNRLSDKVYLPVVFFLIVQMFVSSEIFWAMGLLLCLYIITIKDHYMVIIPFKAFRILLVFLVWGIVLGINIIGNGDTGFRDYLRDIYYYTTPILYMYIGAYYAREKILLSSILNSFIISSAGISIIYLMRIIQQGAIFLLNSDIHGWRSLSGGGAIVIGVSLAIQLSDVIDEDEKMPRAVELICFAISGLFFTLSLSRTNLLIVSILTMALSMNRLNSNKAIKRFMIMIFSIIAAVFLISVLLPTGFVKDYVNKILNSFTEVNASNDWTTATIQDNWRGYENYCAINQWKKSSLIEQIIGSGFGRRIYVGRYAYLYLGQLYADGTPADSIAVLHNGYTTQLIKLGIIGVVLYVIFYLLLIMVGVISGRNTRSVESRLLLAVGLNMLFQTYFLNGLFRDYCYYPMILLIGYITFKVNYMPDDCSDLV